MKTSEFMTTQMKLADPTLSEMSTDLDITSVTQFHLCPTATIYTGTYILADIQQPRARYIRKYVVDGSITFVGSASSTCVVMNSDVFIVPHCSCDCACNLCDIQNGTYMFCYSRTVVPSSSKGKTPSVVYINQPRVQTHRNQYR